MVLAGLHTTYVMTCANAARDTGSPGPASLGARLRAGAVPDWLEPVPQTQGQAVAVYRVIR